MANSEAKHTTGRCEAGERCSCPPDSEMRAQCNLWLPADQEASQRDEAFQQWAEDEHLSPAEYPAASDAWGAAWALGRSSLAQVISKQREALEELQTFIGSSHDIEHWPQEMRDIAREALKETE